MPLTKEESFLILDKEIKELDEKISYIDKKNTELKLNISLIEEEEFFTLDEEINELTRQIFDEEDKNIKLIGEIKVLEKNIKVLEKQKNQKNWKLTFLNVFTFGIFKYYKNKNIDKQIKEIKINRECLKQKINNNKNIIKLLKIKKLKIIKKTNILLKNLFFVNNRLIKINKEFFQQLDNLKNQTAKKEQLRFYNIMAGVYGKNNILRLMQSVTQAPISNKNVVAYNQYSYLINSQRQIYGPDFVNTKEINANYQAGWWATNNIITVSTHEYGHAFDNFLSLTDADRSTFNNNWNWPKNNKIENCLLNKNIFKINNDSSLEQNSSGYNSDDDSDIEVLSESEQEDDILKVSLNKKSIFSEEMEVDVTINKLNFNDDDSDIELLSESEQEDDIFLSKDSGFNEDDGSDNEVLSELEQENDNVKIYSKSSSINFERQLSDIPEEEITIPSSSSDSSFNEDDDGSDIEVLSKSAEEEDAKIFGSCCFSQNLINNFAKSFSTVPPILQQSILTS